MSIDQFSLDVPKALERISRDEKHETRRYSGVTILQEIALAAPSRYYHLITPVEQFFEQLFGIISDPKVGGSNWPSCILLEHDPCLAIHSRGVRQYDARDPRCSH